MSSDEAESRRIAIKRLEFAVGARKLEIELFWRRSLVFWGFVAAAFIGIAATRGSHPRLALLVSCFGLICSMCWTLANRGSKYWYEAWEAKVEREEQNAIKEKLFSEVEEIRSRGLLFSARRYSVSKLAIILSDFTFFLWIGITCYLAATVIEWTMFFRPTVNTSDLFKEMSAVLLLVATSVFIFIAVVKGRSGS